MSHTAPSTPAGGAGFVRPMVFSTRFPLTKLARSATYGAPDTPFFGPKYFAFFGPKYFTFFGPKYFTFFGRKCFCPMGVFFQPRELLRVLYPRNIVFVFITIVFCYGPKAVGFDCIIVRGVTSVALLFFCVTGQLLGEI